MIRFANHHDPEQIARIDAAIGKIYGKRKGQPAKTFVEEVRAAFENLVSPMAIDDIAEEISQSHRPEILIKK